VISPSQRPLPDNTQHSRQTNIHAIGGIRTHDLSRWATAELRLGPRGYWNWRNPHIIFNNFLSASLALMRMWKQDRQCTNNVTLRRVRAAIVALEKQSVLHIHCVCLWTYVSCTQCACTIFSSVAFRLYSIFPHYIINGTIFGKKNLLNIKCVFWFPVKRLKQFSF